VTFAVNAAPAADSEGSEMPRGRGAGEDVDDRAQFYLVTDLLQELKIFGLGIVLRITRVCLVEERSLGSTRTVSDPMQGA
jgi:hypothetical protein